MPIELTAENGGKLLAVHVSGKLAEGGLRALCTRVRAVRRSARKAVRFDMTGQELPALRNWKWSAINRGRVSVV
mgnify:CR=1 FL=1